MPTANQSSIDGIHTSDGWVVSRNVMISTLTTSENTT